MTIYAVSEGAQSKEAERYCFKECGKVIAGALDIMGGAFWPCRTEPCPFEEKRISVGEHPELGEIIVRKLRS